MLLHVAPECTQLAQLDSMDSIGPASTDDSIFRANSKGRNSSKFCIFIEIVLYYIQYATIVITSSSCYYVIHNSLIILVIVFHIVFPSILFSQSYLQAASDVPGGHNLDPSANYNSPKFRSRNQSYMRAVSTLSQASCISQVGNFAFFAPQLFKVILVFITYLRPLVCNVTM